MNAVIQLEVLRRIANGRAINLISVQALNRFYTRATAVVAGWMTSEDRELAMAYRAAAFVQRPCDGVIAFAGDVPPDVAPVATGLPPILPGRGRADKWYTGREGRRRPGDAARCRRPRSPHLFDGGHEWDESCVARAGVFIDEAIAAIRR